MKKIIITLVFSTSVIFLFAQKDTIRLRENSKFSNGVVTDRPPQAIYFMFGGSGPLLSVNYDRRFQKRVNGVGFAAGIGFFGESGTSIFSIPVSINYLIGRDSHFLEIAGGATYISARSTDIFGSSSSSGSLVFYHLNIGYRYQPSRGGFFFRGGLSPLFYGGDYVTSYYLGFGHNF
jgi:hypothetical protein